MQTPNNKIKNFIGKVQEIKKNKLLKKEKDYQMENVAADFYFDEFIKKNNSTIDLNKPLLEVVNLRKQYFGKKKPAIDQLNFKVFPGEFHAFVGANGAGKTCILYTSPSPRAS